MARFKIKFKRLDVYLATAALVVLLILGFLLFVPVDGSAGFRRIHIPNGSGLNTIAQILKDEGLIRSKYAFVIFVMANGDSKNLKAGSYRFSESMSAASMANLIAGGKAESLDVNVVIPEGYNIWEIDQRLTDVGLIDEGEFARAAYKEEGYFFPDTYRFDPRSSVEDIIQKLKGNFAVKSPWIPTDKLILASILEKEGGDFEDMQIIAGIIQNRIQKGMLLQVDATVMYGACIRTAVANNFARNCDTSQIGVGREIAIDGPYNSYKRPGLPPGPISNPGLDAINAALNPTKSNYYYYLHGRDGTPYYSKTGAEHEAKRRKYLGL